MDTVITIAFLATSAAIITVSAAICVRTLQLRHSAATVSVTKTPFTAGANIEMRGYSPKQAAQLTEALLDLDAADTDRRLRDKDARLASRAERTA